MNSTKSTATQPITQNLHIISNYSTPKNFSSSSEFEILRAKQVTKDEPKSAVSEFWTSCLNFLDKMAWPIKFFIKIFLNFFKEIWSFFDFLFTPRYF